MIGIIGFGRFGRLASRYLAEDYDVFVYSRAGNLLEINSIGARAASLKTVCGQEIVIPCVPISIFRNFLKDIAPLIMPDALVVDVCSVKQYPIRWMKEILPDTVSILATHPMFGPDSAADSLVGRKICLCKVKISEKRYSNIKSYLEAKGLVVIETTAAEHDKQIAVSLALTHLIGRTLSQFGAAGSISIRKGIIGCCIFSTSSSAIPGNCSSTCIATTHTPERSGLNLLILCRRSIPDWSRGIWLIKFVELIGLIDRKDY
jgi:prephenate dehydrogenase